MSELKPCPRCGTKAYLSRDVVDGFYFGWSAGCPRYCHYDGIHGTTIDTSEEDCYAVHYETIPTDALSKCEPFCYSMPLTEDYVKRCKMKVIGNIWDKSEDAKPKETDNIIYHDFMKKGRE